MANAEQKRQSIVRFVGANGGTVVEPLSTFVSTSNPPKFQKTTQRDHIEEQMRIATQHLENAKLQEQQQQQQQSNANAASK